MVRSGWRRGPAGGATEGYFAEPGSFAAFYVSHYPRMLGWFMRRVSQPEQARDLTAETFATAFEERMAFRGQNERVARAWVFGIAEIKLKNFYGRNADQAEALRRLGFALPPPDEEELRRIEEIADAKVAGYTLWEEIGKLKPRERDVLLKHVVDGATFAEIVGADGDETPDAAKKRYARTVAKLSARLSRHRELQEHHGREVDDGER